MAGEPSDSPPKRLISVAEAARRLGISESAAYRLAAAGTLPGQVKLPGTRSSTRVAVVAVPPGAAKAGTRPRPKRTNTRPEAPGRTEERHGR